MSCDPGVFHGTLPWIALGCQNNTRPLNKTIYIYMYVCICPTISEDKTDIKQKNIMRMKRKWTGRLSLLVLYQRSLVGCSPHAGCKPRSSPAATPAAPEVWTFMSLGTAHAYTNFLLKPAHAWNPEPPKMKFWKMVGNFFLSFQLLVFRLMFGRTSLFGGIALKALNCFAMFFLQGPKAANRS